MYYLSLLALFQEKFRFQPNIYDDCREIRQKSTSLNDVAVVTSGGNDYRIQFWFKTKSKAVDRITKM